MTELQLYKFIEEFNPEYRWQDNEGSEDVMMWVSKYHYESFCELFEGSGFFDESGYDATICGGGYLAVWMDDICQYFSIDMANVFKK